MIIWDVSFKELAPLWAVVDFGQGTFLNLARPLRGDAKFPAYFRQWGSILFRWERVWLVGTMHLGTSSLFHEAIIGYFTILA
jgi:hypothetical protein